MYGTFGDISKAKKRKYGEATGTSDLRVRRARAIAAKINKAFPYSEFGRAYYRRGTPDNIARFGETFKTASPDQKALRKLVGYSGKGKYKGKGGYWGRTIGNLFGLGDLGDKLGDAASSVIRSAHPAGNALMNAANLAGSLHRRYKGKGIYTGSGAYASNDLVGGGPDIPSFTASSDGVRVTISHKEFLGNLYAPGIVGQNQNVSWALQAYNLNPGLEATFPWLSQIACNFDEYTMHQLMFTFKSTVSDFASSSGQIGTVIAATAYNSASDLFPDKKTMLEYDSSASCRVTTNMIHGVECDPAKLSGPVGKYVRIGPVLATQDINQYDAGIFQLAVADVPGQFNGQSLGEIWVSYTVELRKPRFFSAKGLAVSRDFFTNSFPTTLNIWTKPLGDLATTSGATLLHGLQNNIGGQLDLSLSGSSSNIGALNSINQPKQFLFSTSASITSLSTLLAAPLAYQYTLPGNYSGNLKITVVGACTVMFRPTTAYVAVGTSGNIYGVYDIPIATGVAATPYNWSMWQANVGSDGTAGPSYTYIIEFHVRVGQATNGQDNTLTFSVNTGTEAANYFIGGCLEVEEYNAGLNYSLTGVNDKIMLANSFGQQVSV